MTPRHHIDASFNGSNAFAVLLVFVVFFIFTVSTALAAGTISEGYASEADYRPGTLVSLSSVSPPTVTLASLVNNGYLVGVVESPTSSLLSLDNSDSDVSVALEGDVVAFVSDINGNIKPGDFIGTSWIAGVGMRANSTDEQRLLGIALQDFNTSHSDVRTVQNIETPGGKTSAKIGSITLRLFDRDVGPEVSDQLGVLENIANRIAGKNVPLARAILAVGLFTITVVIAGVFLANAIRGSFISLGRNPLAGGSIFASLMQVSGVSISLLLIGSVLAYVILIL